MLRSLRATLAAVFLLLPACAQQVSTSMRAPEQRRADTLTPQERDKAESFCPLGIPVKVQWNQFHDTDYVVRDGYALEHSAEHKIPLWVAEHIAPSHLGGNEARVNSFKADPEIDAGRRAELSDYAGSGYDRGHMAPAGNQTRSARLKKETFFLSNMAPQAPELNRLGKPWETLEGIVRDWAEDRPQGAFTFTGNLFYDPEEENAATADGFIDFWQIGSNLVSVPTHCYKIVYARGASAAANDWEAIALVLPNQDEEFEKPFDFSVWVVPIDFVERHTGLDFFRDLDDLDEDALEAATPALWN